MRELPVVITERHLQLWQGVRDLIRDRVGVNGGDFQLHAPNARGTGIWFGASSLEGIDEIGRLLAQNEKRPEQGAEAQRPTVSVPPQQGERNISADEWKRKAEELAFALRFLVQKSKRLLLLLKGAHIEAFEVDLLRLNADFSQSVLDETGMG